MPDCLRSRAALTRVCRAKTVLPVPGPPMTSVVRFRGSPPRLSSSNPLMPVASLDKRGAALFRAGTLAPDSVHHTMPQKPQVRLYGTDHKRRSSGAASGRCKARTTEDTALGQCAPRKVDSENTA